MWSNDTFFLVSNEYNLYAHLSMTFPTTLVISHIDLKIFIFQGLYQIINLQMTTQLEINLRKMKD